MAEEIKPRPYLLGTLLWAKIGSHPYWPCMVSYDPSNGAFFKRKAKTVVHHVQYFGKSVQHGWTTDDTLIFRGGNKFFAQRDEDLAKASAKQKSKLKKKYYVPPSVMKEWLIAIKESEKAMSYRIEDRHELFVFKYDINFKKVEKEKEKRRRRRKGRKPVKKLPPKVISETTNIVEPLCFYCEKGNVDLFCSSGVCTQSFHKQCVGIIHAPNFICANCSVGEQPCMICKSVGMDATKCSQCKNHYHDYCLKLFKCADIKKNVCSAHVCWSCYLRHPQSAQNDAGTLVTCFRCPTAYHDTINCLPAGGARLSPTQIICPQHFLGKNSVSPQPHKNVNFCSACFSNGKLVCCEGCSHAYHDTCINGEIPLGDFYCDDCSRKKGLYAGMIVWAKSGIFRWWPAQVLNPEDVPSNIKALHRYDGEFPIQFFGSDEYTWTHRGRVFPYNKLNQNMRISCSRANKDLWMKFKIGLEEAVEAYKAFLDEKSKDKSSKPPHFRHIRVNRAIPPASIPNIPQSACSCSPSDENPCGPDSFCLNRSMLYECHPDNCKAGDKCQNQRFQKREYAPAKVMKTSDRGWGLKATKFIPEGLFVNEYVGEVITQKLYEQRVIQIRMMDVQNYYFLSLGKGRLIDAGPSGNLSRFINHSCDPNCVMEKWSVNGDMRIGIFAVTDIMPGEEITFNYQCDGMGFGQKCFCGAPNCVGVVGMNGKKKRKLK